MQHLLPILADVVCVVVAACLIVCHATDPIVWILFMGIIYQHGLVAWARAPGIPWMYLKWLSGAGFLYALSKRYYDVALVMGYSCMSKFIPNFEQQLPWIVILFTVTVTAAYLCHFPAETNKTHQ